MLSNYKKTKLETLVFMDIETQSTVDLRKLGSTVYANHPDTRIMSAVFLKGNKCTVWVNKESAPEGLMEEIIEPVTGFGFDDHTVELKISNKLPYFHKTNTFIAHNAEQFDSQVYPEKDRRWFDSINPVRCAGLPGGIDGLGQLFFNHGKDEFGKRAMLMLSKAKETKGKIIYNRGTIALWKQMLRYNIIDVLIMRYAYLFTQDYVEQGVLDAHSKINERGIYIDVAYLKHLWSLWDNVEASAHKRISELTEGKITGANIKSSVAVKQWLLSQGMMLDRLSRSTNDDGTPKISISKAVLENFFDNPIDYLDEGCDSDDDIARIVSVLELRSMANRTSKAKLTRMMLSVNKDNRLRNTTKYYGAHTGRWAGVGVQPQNLGKGITELDVEECIKLYNSGRLDLEHIKTICNRLNVEHPNLDCREDDVLTTLLRPVFCARPGYTLGVIDYGAIECRGLAWLAGEKWLLDGFNQPKFDPYLTTASDIYGRPITKDMKDERQVGKVTVLGSGYQMGSAKFKVFCTNTKPRVDLTKAGTTAEMCIKKYRERNKSIVRQWKHYELAALEAIKGRPIETGKCRFYSKDGCLHIELPSGRRLTYRGIELVREVPFWALAKGLQVAAKDTIKYRHTFGHQKTLYGGLITENITQAVCSDLIRTLIQDLEALEKLTVLHVHDEIVFEAKDSDIKDELEQAAILMSTSPLWGKDFPIAVEGHANKRYVKSAFKDDLKIKAHKGVVI